MSKYACGYIIYFKDDGEPEEQIFHVGSHKECEQTGKLFQAVSYSGNRPIKNCEFVIVPMEAKGGGEDELK